MRIIFASNVEVSNSTGTKSVYTNNTAKKYYIITKDFSLELTSNI